MTDTPEKPKEADRPPEPSSGQRRFYDPLRQSEWEAKQAAYQASRAAWVAQWEAHQQAYERQQQEQQQRQEGQGATPEQPTRPQPAQQPQSRARAPIATGPKL